MRLLTAALFFALAACATGADDKDDKGAKEAAKKLEGTYEVLEVIVGGKQDNSKKDEVESFVIKDGELTIKIAKGNREEIAKFTLDPSKKPGHINLMPKRNDKDESVAGIYQVKETDKGTELTIAFGKGSGKDRPKDFKGDGEDDVVIKLFRKKAK
jgi:uncharacterized protein (TIGR03067 family)